MGSECVHCGFCCRQGPCPFGKWADGQCQFLVAWGLGFRCAIYDEIKNAPGAQIAPAFGAGCGSRLCNDDYEVAVFLRHYVITALWSSTDDEGSPLDDDYDVDDLAPKTIEKMRADCAQFHVANRRHYTDIGRAAHDFWLTRNHHGAGFWDGDYPEPEATLLTDAAQAFRECDLYTGDDGQLYLSP